MSSPENNSAQQLNMPFDYKIDTCGMICPLPLLKMKQALNAAEIGETIFVEATDPVSQRDFQAFIQMTPHELVSRAQNGHYYYWITKKA